MAAASSLGVAAAPHSELKGLLPSDAAAAARRRVVDLHVSEQLGSAPRTPLLPGLIVGHSFAPNARIGLGLASILVKRRLGGDAQKDAPAPRSRKPAVTFTFKF